MTVERAISDEPGALKRAITKLFDRERLKAGLNRAGFDTTHWCRVIAYRTSMAWLSELPLGTMDVLEISGTYWSSLPVRAYTSAYYPEYDVCAGPLPRAFDLVIADQVFEHVDDPAAGIANIRKMLKPGGYMLILAPFLLKVHGYPNDCTRWTERGLRNLLISNGFDTSEIKSGSWGNKACAVANFRHGWRMYGWGKSLKNDPTFTVMSWVLARSNS
jgi:SAM-dependent methyltransferase